MNQNLSRRPTTASRPKPSPIRLDAIAFNERAAFVESVCNSLIESRFGPGSLTTFTFHRTESPELEPMILCDLIPESPVPSFSILPDPETVRRRVAAMLLDESGRNALAASSIRRQNISPSNLGRGSPQISGTHASLIFETS